MKKQITKSLSIFSKPFWGPFFGLLLFSLFIPYLSAEDVGVTTNIKTGGSSSYTPSTTDTIVNQVKVKPEKRVNPEQNYDTEFYFSVRDPVTDQQVWRSGIIRSSEDGTYNNPISLGGIPEGNYDVIIKSKSHLSQRLENVAIQAGENTLNFTNSVNAAGNDGEQVLAAGDINGLGIDPDSMGDDVVNAIDLSILLEDMQSPDPTGDGLRSNLNQDTIVDQNDLIILLSNLNKKGKSNK